MPPTVDRYSTDSQWLTYRAIYRPTYRPLHRSSVGRHIDRYSADVSVDISTDISTDIYRPIHRSSVGRDIDWYSGRVSVDNVGRHSTDVSVDISADTSVEGCTKYTWSNSSPPFSFFYHHDILIAAAGFCFFALRKGINNAHSVIASFSLTLSIPSFNPQVDKSACVIDLCKKLQKTKRYCLKDYMSEFVCVISQVLYPSGRIYPAIAQVYIVCWCKMYHLVFYKTSVVELSDVIWNEHTMSSSLF